MKRKYSTYYLLRKSVLVFALQSSILFAQNNEFGMFDHTGQYIQDSITVINADSELFNLSDLIDKTTIIAMVYYDCQQQCPRVLQGIGELIFNLPLQLGNDYQVITIGFNEEESLNALSTSQNEQYSLVKARGKNIANGWDFYTADQENIKRLSKNLGYGFYKQGSDYMHVSFLTVISPKGKIINYMYGYRYLPLDFELTYKDAINEKVKTTVPRNLKYCTNYIAPAHGKLHKIAVIFGLLILASSLTLFLVLTLKKQDKKYVP